MKHHSKVLTVASMLALAALGLGTTGIAVAQDAKSMSGGLCLPYMPANSPYDPWTQTKFYAVNAHSGALTYTCPAITRDNETSTTGLASATVSVRVQPDTAMECTIRSASQFNTTLDFVTKTHTNSGAAYVDVDIAFGSGLNVSANNSIYGLACTVPPSGRIYAYRWAEN